MLFFTDRRRTDAVFLLRLPYDPIKPSWLLCRLRHVPETPIFHVPSALASPVSSSDPVDLFIVSRASCRLSLTPSVCNSLLAS